MTDKPAPFVPTRRARKRIVSGTLTFCAVAVTYLIGWGNPDNVLHVNALSWCFTLVGAVVGAYVTGSVLDNRASLRRE